MDDLNFFEIDVSYVDYLKNIEINKRGFSRVPNMVYDKNRKQKLICGVVLVVNNIDYYVPLTSFKKSMPDNFLILDRNKTPLSSLRFNYMFPVPSEKLSVKSISDESDKKYQTLLAKELLYCIKNEELIRHRAKRTYKRVLLGKDKGLVVNSCDFKLLEQAYIKYCLDNGLELPKDLQTQEALSQKEEVYQQVNLNQINDLANSGIPFKAKKISDDSFIIVFDEKYSDRVNQILSQHTRGSFKPKI